MSIWHKEISHTIDAVVDNPHILHLLQRWQACRREAGTEPALLAFDPRTTLPDMQDNLMLLACEGDDLRYLYYGRDIARHAGFDMTGQSVSAFGGELAAFFRQRYDRVLSTGEPLYTVHSAVRATPVFTWERLILPVTDANGQRYLCVYNRPLESRAHILDVLIQTSSNALMVLRAQTIDGEVEPSWVIVLANQRFADMAHCTVQELLGRSVAGVLSSWPMLQPRADACLHASQADLGGLTDLVLPIGSGPEQRWYKAQVDPIPMGCVIRLIDVTSLKASEEALQADNTRLANWAHIDGLTGIANRRALDAFLTDECARAVRHGLPLCVALCDIDHFKAYNDLHGHLKGDDCIRAVAQLLQRGAARPADLVARFGGEEFVVVMPHTTLQGAVDVVRKSMALLRQLAIEHGASTVDSHVTASFGITCWQHGVTQSTAQLLERADQALYESKRGGRNRYTVIGN